MGAPFFFLPGLHSKEKRNNWKYSSIGREKHYCGEEEIMSDIPRVFPSSEIADTLASLERLEDADLIAMRSEIERICRQKRILAESRRSQKLVKLGAVSLGETFLYRTVEILGEAYANSRKPPYEGTILTVVGFRPRYVNQVIVEEPSGCQSLLPLWEVEKALKFHKVASETKMAAALDSSPRPK